MEGIFQQRNSDRIAERSPCFVGDTGLNVIRLSETVICKMWEGEGCVCVRREREKERERRRERENNTRSSILIVKSIRE